MLETCPRCCHYYHHMMRIRMFLSCFCWVWWHSYSSSKQPSGFNGIQWDSWAMPIQQVFAGMLGHHFEDSPACLRQFLGCLAEARGLSESLKPWETVCQSYLSLTEVTTSIKVQCATSAWMPGTEVADMGHWILAQCSRKIFLWTTIPCIPLNYDYSHWAFDSLSQYEVIWAVTDSVTDFFGQTSIPKITCSRRTRLVFGIKQAQSRRWDLSSGMTWGCAS